MLLLHGAVLVFGSLGGSVDDTYCGRCIVKQLLIPTMAALLICAVMQLVEDLIQLVEDLMHHWLTHGMTDMQVDKIVYLVTRIAAYFYMEKLVQACVRIHLLVGMVVYYWLVDHIMSKLVAV